jgi:hypothetical protein
MVANNGRLRGSDPRAHRVYLDVVVRTADVVFGDVGVGIAGSDDWSRC